MRIVECSNCAWQGKGIDTDSGYCLQCGGECFDLKDIYGPNGLYPDPEWKEEE